MPRVQSWTDIINGKGYRRSLAAGWKYLFGKRGQRLVGGMRMYYHLRILALLRTGETLQKLARKNDIRLWIDGKEAFPRIERLIRRAKDHIHIQMFIWKNDETGRHVASLLLDAANRGVKIDITKEAIGDFFEFRGDFLGSKESKEHPWPLFWRHPNIRVLHTTSNDHAKVFVFDGQTLVLTGMNISNEYRYNWHDYMVELQGSRYVEQFLTRKRPGRLDTSVRLVMNTDERKDMRTTVMHLLSQVEEQIVIEVCYISDPEVLQKLVDMSKRGIRIVIILPKWTEFHHHKNLASVGKVLAEGKNSYISVFMYPDHFHAKVMLIDSNTAFIGSMNLFRASIDEMGEVNVLIRNKRRVVWKLRESLRQDILKSKAISSIPGSLWISRWLACLGL